MKVAVIDTGAGNLQSVCNALEKLGQSFGVAGDPAELSSFEKIILPGVGAAGPAMKKLTEKGFDRVLRRERKPVLGICLGLELLAEFSEEDQTPCLGIVPGRARRFPKGLKVPQIGWNSVEWRGPNPLSAGIPGGSYFYFVHSYYLEAAETVTLAESLYGVLFSSVIRKDNFYGVQFHPEKSGPAGLRLLANFCRDAA